MTGADATLILLAHGTRDGAGAAEIDRLAELLRGDGTAVAVGFADVGEPTLATVLTGLDGPAVVVPAFLSGGYHVHVDVPAQLAATGRAEVLLARPLGPDRALVEVLRGRLVAAGWRAGDRVVLAAAGSADRRALEDVSAAAAQLQAVLGQQVVVGYATGTPRVADVVASMRRAGGGRIAVATWLLAPGLFYRVLAASGAEVVAAPLGAHPGVAGVIRARFESALGCGAG